MSHGEVHDPPEHPYDVWEAENSRRTGCYLRLLDSQYEEARWRALRATARARKASTASNGAGARRRALRAQAEADEAWAIVRTLEGSIDALGRPIDPGPAGRLRFAEAHLIASGVPLIYPDIEEPNADHRAGLHPDPAPRGWYGDLSCDDCMEDEGWVEDRARHAAFRARIRGRKP